MSYMRGKKPERLDNNPVAHRAKVTIRQNVLKAVKEPVVFDAFAGSGEMYSAVWKDADGYTGCDLKPQRDNRLMFCADNRRVMRAIELAPFTVFDFDSYGSPWEQCVILANRRRVKRGEMIGVILTDGAGFTYNINQMSEALSVLSGLRNVVGLSKNVETMIDRAIIGLARVMNCTLEHRWQANGKTTAKVRYIGLVLKGK